VNNVGDGLARSERRLGSESNARSEGSAERDPSPSTKPVHGIQNNEGFGSGCCAVKDKASINWTASLIISADLS
jgi:hypothetical protein